MIRQITTFIACLAAVVALQATASAATVTLKNGDRITGNIVSQADGKITIETELLGTLTVPADGASIEGAEEPVTATPAATDAEAQAAAATGATTAQATDGEGTPTEEADKTEALSEADILDFHAAVARAKAWVDDIVPEGWGGRFQLGANFTETNSKTTGLTIGFDANKDSGDNHYTIFAFYDYKNSVNQAGVQDKQLDKWGGGFKYRHDFGEHFFFLSNSSYLRDQVKDIRNEFTQDIGIGYYIFNDADMVLYVAPAFSPQYKDAERVGKKWYYMATIIQEFKFKLNESVRIEQNAQGSIEPNDDNNYSYKFRVAAITKLTDWIDLIVAYNYNYDNTVGAGGSKKEQIASISLGIPF